MDPARVRIVGTPTADMLRSRVPKHPSRIFISAGSIGRSADEYRYEIGRDWRQDDEAQQDRHGTAAPRIHAQRRRAAAAFTILPGHVLGGPRHIAPSDRVNIAGVGVGGMGRANMQALSSQNIVAMCDVDWSFVDARFADIPKQIEAASKRLGEATRRHAEATRTRADRRLAAAAGADRQGEALYRLPRDARRSRRTSTRWSSRRPITRTRSSRSRRWTSANTCTCRSRWPGRSRNAAGSPKRATETKLQTQMGNQGHSSDDARARQRIHPVGRDRHRHRSARVDQPAARVLAAGHSAPRAAAGERQGSAVEHERRDDARRGLVRHATRRPTSSPGTCSSGPRATSNITLSTTRSTGAAGPTGAWAPSATWARISSIPRSGRWISTIPTSVETTSTPYNHDTYPMACDDLLRIPGARARGLP